MLKLKQFVLTLRDKWSKPETEEPSDLYTVDPHAPRWNQLRMAIASSDAYCRIIATSAETQLWNALLIEAVGDLHIPGTINDVLELWNRIARVSEPTAEEIAELNKILEDGNAPFRLIPTGQMVVRVEDEDETREEHGLM